MRHDRRPTRRAGLRAPERLEQRQLLAVLPPGFREDLVVQGLRSPTAMAIAPDGRIFVAQKNGAIRVIKDGVLLPNRFAFLAAERSYEYGLCGLALDPNFTTNGYVYVNYIAQGTPTRNIIERLTADGDVAAPGSSTTIFEVAEVNPPGPTGNYHVGGAMHFGIDGKLYVATGDNTNPADAQSLGNLHGKILRINPDGTIPADNPFFTIAQGNARAMWAYGLRNAFTFAIQPGSGTMLINDVGQNSYEEINLGRAGGNYGWPLTEGPTTDPRFDAPLHAYSHASTAQGAACIAGGVFYDPATTAFPAAYTGRYFFADFNNAWMSTLDPNTGEVASFATDISPMTVDIDVGPDGAIYYLAWGNGASVNRVSYTGTLEPSISRQPAATTVAAGFEASFAAAATGDGLLSHRWQRAEPGSTTFVDLPGATAATLTLPDVTVGDSQGRYRVIVSNRHGSVTSDPATLTVVANSPPAITVSSPAGGTRFSGGDRISFTASAHDSETGPLPAAALSWQVDMLHGTVARPIVPPTSGSSGEFVVPDDTPYTRSDVMLRLTVSAPDPVSGILGSTTVDLLPRISVVTLASSAPGIVLGLDGEPLSTPYAVESVAGTRRSLSAAPFQITATGFQRFLGWQDGGDAARDVRVPATDTTYLAHYAPSPVYVESFDGGDDLRFRPLSGTWQMNAQGAYRGGLLGTDAAISALDADLPLSATFDIGAEIRLNAGVSNGFVIFDVADSSDFKYVGLRGRSGEIVAGRRTPQGWKDEMAVRHAWAANGSVPIAVRVSGSEIRVTVEGGHVFEHDFGESLTGRGVGLASRSGGAEFDRFFLRNGGVDPGVFVTATSIPENNAPGGLVGILGTRGWGYGATFRYELVPGTGDADNAAFAIQGDQLRAATRFNFERRSSYTIRVRSTEATGVISEQPLAITIEDDPAEHPRVEAVAGPPAGVYRAGDTLLFTVEASHAVVVHGLPELSFQIGRTVRKAVYTTGSGTTTLTFSCIVSPSDRAGTVTLGRAIRLPMSSSITAAGAPLATALPQPGAAIPNVVIDNLPPQPVGTLATPAPGTYKTGTILRFRVAFSEPVFVVGTPTIRLVLGHATRTVSAEYESGSGTNKLTFAYRSGSDDAMPPRQWVAIARQISLATGASITDSAGNQARLSLRTRADVRIRLAA